MSQPNDTPSSATTRLRTRRYPDGKCVLWADAPPEYREQVQEALSRSASVTLVILREKLHAELLRRGVPDDVALRCVASAGGDAEIWLRGDWAGR